MRNPFRRTPTDALSSLGLCAGEYELPHFPTATLRTLETIRDQEASIGQVAESLCVDPGLSVRVLKLVNSAGFGLRHAVEDLSHAVHLMGRAPLESMLISIAVRDALPNRPRPGFEPARFWRAAARRAAVARRLAALLCPAETSRVFTAALLQEMGVALLVEQRGDPYQALLERWRRGEAPLHELEREAFGWDHAQVGSAMCRHWELPEDLARAVAGHHDEPSSDSEVPAPVTLSAFLGEGDEDPGVDELVAAAEARHDLDRKALFELVEAGFQDADDLAQQLA